MSTCFVSDEPNEEKATSSSLLFRNGGKIAQLLVRCTELEEVTGTRCTLYICVVTRRLRVLHFAPYTSISTAFVTVT